MRQWSERIEAWDEAASRRLRLTDRRGLLRSLAAFLAHSGDSWFWGLGLLALIFWGPAPFWRSWALVQLSGIFFLAVLVMILKFTFRRRRPQGDWGGIYRATDPHSFPSGHAARAIFLALVSWFLGGPAWLSLLLTLWAPLVALARVAMGVHYLSDILGGLLFGLLLALGWVNALGM
ncbi:MAG: phosphatase PAP2 family protein [Anaerolineales bacterium]